MLIALVPKDNRKENNDIVSLNELTLFLNVLDAVCEVRLPSLNKNVLQVEERA